MSGDPAAALPHFDRAIALAPKYAAAHNNRGNALRDLKRPAEAIAACQTAVELQPDYAEAHNNTAAAMMDMRAFTSALEPLRRAIALHPNIAIFNQNLGLTLSSLGHPAEPNTATATEIGRTSDRERVCPYG